MPLQEKIKTKFSQIAIPNLTLILVAGQALSFTFGVFRPDILPRLSLSFESILKGEFWRLFTFMFLPPASNPFLIFFAFYFLYAMGSFLEAEWGEARYTLYVFIGYVSTVAVSFLFPSIQVDNLFILESIFLAFAYMYPDFTVYLFFVLPLKIKYLAAFTWVMLGLNFLFADFPLRISLLGSVLNFLIFFGKDIVLRTGASQNKSEPAGVSFVQDPSVAFHQCNLCGLTEKDSPNMDFRMCLDCPGGKEYCSEHISEHSH